MTTLTQVFDGLATRLKTIEGLNVETSIKEAWQFPALLVLAPNIFDSDGLAENDYPATFDLFLLVSSAAEADQKQLLPYIDPQGPKSVQQAIKADRTLGGLPGVSARFLGWPRQLSFDAVAAYRAYGKEGQVRVWMP